MFNIRAFLKIKIFDVSLSAQILFFENAYNIYLEKSMKRSIFVIIFLFCFSFISVNIISFENSMTFPFHKINYIIDLPYKSSIGSHKSFVKTFEDNSLDGFTAIESSDKDHIGIINRNEDGNNSAVWFSVTKNQKLVNNGMRSELSYDNRDPEGSEMWYGWSIFIPSDFALPSDYHIRQKKPWIVMGQWHDQPDSLVGETWETFPSNSPPISYGFGHDGNDFKMALVYGNHITGSKSFLFAIQTGTWNRIVTHIKWSTASDGFAETFLNDKLCVSVKGPNMNNHVPHYMKIGLYRDKSIKTDNILAYDDIKIGFNQNEVK